MAASLGRVAMAASLGLVAVSSEIHREILSVGRVLPDRRVSSQEGGRNLLGRVTLHHMCHVSAGISVGFNKFERYLDVPGESLVLNIGAGLGFPAISRLSAVQLLNRVYYMYLLDGSLS